MNSNTTSRPTFQATTYAMQDDAVLSVHTFTVTIKRTGDTLTTATVDGQPAGIECAAHLITWPQQTGTLVITDHFDAPTIDKARATRLHHLLGPLNIFFGTRWTTLRRTVQPTFVQLHVGI